MHKCQFDELYVDVKHVDFFVWLLLMRRRHKKIMVILRWLNKCFQKEYQDKCTVNMTKTKLAT